MQDKYANFKLKQKWRSQCCDLTDLPSRSLFRLFLVMLISSLRQFSHLSIVLLFSSSLSFAFCLLVLFLLPFFFFLFPALFFLLFSLLILQSSQWILRIFFWLECDRPTTFIALPPLLSRYGGKGTVEASVFCICSSR